MLKDYKKARERDQSLSKEEKKRQKQQQYGLERYKNLPEDEKKLAECRKNIK